MARIGFQVQGTPTTDQSIGSEWRKRIIATVQAKAHQERWPIPIRPSKNGFRVVVRFRLDKAFETTDLDNLVKPVLDALFLCGEIYKLDMQTEAALSDLHDSSVESLLIEKTKSVNEGISVELEWTE